MLAKSRGWPGKCWSIAASRTASSAALASATRPRLSTPRLWRWLACEVWEKQKRSRRGDGGGREISSDGRGWCRPSHIIAGANLTSAGHNVFGGGLLARLHTGQACVDSALSGCRRLPPSSIAASSVECILQPPHAKDGKRIWGWLACEVALQKLQVQDSALERAQEPGATARYAQSRAGVANIGRPHRSNARGAVAF